MASDSSESPMVLTPESTGTSGLNADNFLDSPTMSTTTAKKTRRQTAFYPNMNSTNKPLKPFSRSAAKRESVMALGSIEHLQHYFTKTGLAAKKNPLDKPHHGLVLAIGGMGNIPTSPALSDIQDFQMPPSPAIPIITQPQFSPHVKNWEVDPESLLPGVIEDIISVAQVWKLERYSDPNSTVDLNISFDILEVLKTTTRAIRSIRNYLLSLPDESAGSIRAHFRPSTLGPGTSAVNSSSSSLPASSSTSSIKQTEPDPIILIRRSALEVLTILRQMEENWRLPLSDDAYDAQSDGGHTRGPTASSPSNGLLDLPHDERLHASGSEGGIDPDASITYSLVQVQGRYESVPVWEDEEDVFEAEEEKEKKDAWDERLVLGSGWLYRQDVKLKDLTKERNVIGAYLDIVDEVLFEGKHVPGEERGWDKVRRKREGRASSRAAKVRRVRSGEGRLLGLVDVDAGKRRASTGMANMMREMTLSEEPDDMDDIKEEEESIDDDELPDWAKRSSFIDDRLGRVHALIQAFLPSHLQASLKYASRTDLLTSLSSGQLLCIAYNSCVRNSKKPWGFVSKDGIHDIIALEVAAQQTTDEKEGKKLWTFRRTDNLRLWAGALKLRYMIPIQFPSQPLPGQGGSSSVAGTPLSSPTATAQRFMLSREPPVSFDARIVARKDDGWEEMLEDVLNRWVDKVVDERRQFQ